MVGGMGWGGGRFAAVPHHPTFIKFDIKSSAKLLLKAMQKHLWQPIFRPRLYSGKRWLNMVGITRQKKKCRGVLDINVLFFAIKL